MNKISLIAGTRGTGKTDFAKKIIAASSQPKKLIVDTFDNDVWQTLETHDHLEWNQIAIKMIESRMLARWRQGLYRIGSSNTDQTIIDIELHLQNAMILFEDATKYIGSKLSKEMNRFCLDSKQKNLDLVFIFHSMNQIPNGLIRIADTLTLFKTNEDIPSKTKFPFPQIPMLMELVKNDENRFANATIQLN